uniref:Uncharacterized protein n=1 Tax=Maylandia zebra TaxID=106582 RepID=A0A3P9CN70_9CICH
MLGFPDAVGPRAVCLSPPQGKGQHLLRLGDRHLFRNLKDVKEAPLSSYFGFPPPPKKCQKESEPQKKRVFSEKWLQELSGLQTNASSPPATTYVRGCVRAFGYNLNSCTQTRVATSYLVRTFYFDSARAPADHLCAPLYIYIPFVLFLSTIPMFPSLCVMFS